MQVQLSEERERELVDDAQRHGQDPSVALDEMVTAALEWEQQDYRKAVQGIRHEYADVKAGRAQPLHEAFDELRAKYALPR